jgi:hypothetical protein
MTSPRLPFGLNSVRSCLEHRYSLPPARAKKYDKDYFLHVRSPANNVMKGVVASAFDPRTLFHKERSSNSRRT